MADRHTLHINQLEDFKAWLIKDGWEVEELKGLYEVLRARKTGRRFPLIVYKKDSAKQHLTLQERDLGVVRAFLKDKKTLMTNFSKIHEMNIKELADFLSEVKYDGIYHHEGQEYPMQKAVWEEWLQAESER